MGLIMQNGISYGGANIVKLTQAEYNSLPNDKLSDNNIYLITDSSEFTAENLFYDDTETQLGANDVQNAIVELNSKLDELMTVKSQNGNTEIFTLPSYSSGTTAIVNFPTKFNSVPEVNVIMTRLDLPSSGYDPYFSCVASNITEVGFLLTMSNNTSSAVRVQVSWSASI